MVIDPHPITWHGHGMGRPNERAEMPAAHVPHLSQVAGSRVAFRVVLLFMFIFNVHVQYIGCVSAGGCDRRG